MFSKPDKDGTNYWPLIILSVGVIGLFALSWWWMASTIGDPEKQGLFGDQFGAVNALFSGLAFAGLIYTIILQKQELSLQREELRQTRKELNGQTRQFEAQNKNLKIQRFENRLYNMLNLQQEIVNSLKFEYSDSEEVIAGIVNGRTKKESHFVKKIVVGREVFRFLFDNYCVSFNRSYTRGLRSILGKFGLRYYDDLNYVTCFDHYFCHLYAILQFIDKESQKEGPNRIFSDEELYSYTKTVRATLSRYELVWLYYNGLSGYGNEKFKPLIERYCMLKNLRKDLLSMCNENQEELAKRGLSTDMVKQKEYTGTDYEFFLTSEYNIKTKYHISAFYNTVQDQAYAVKCVEAWEKFLGENDNRAEE